jgi:hypothetical protein
MEATILEQISYFNYFESNITFKKDVDVFQKFQNMCGTLTRTLKRKWWKKSDDIL